MSRRILPVWDVATVLVYLSGRACFFILGLFRRGTELLVADERRNSILQQDVCCTNLITFTIIILLTKFYYTTFPKYYTHDNGISQTQDSALPFRSIKEEFLSDPV